MTASKVAKTHCKHGHDLAVVGVNSRGRCAECKRDENRRYREANPERNRENNRAGERRYREAHRAERAEGSRRYREANPERKRESNRRYNEATRRACLDHYGDGKCHVCRTSENLHLHHVNGDGEAHRKVLGSQGGGGFYQHLVRNDFPDDPPLQVLCVECHAYEHSFARLRGVSQRELNSVVST